MQEETRRRTSIVLWVSLGFGIHNSSFPDYSNSHLRLRIHRFLESNIFTSTIQKPREKVVSSAIYLKGIQSQFEPNLPDETTTLGQGHHSAYHHLHYCGVFS